MSFDTFRMLEIPQGATELSLNELKQISGGCDNHKDGKHKCRLVKKIVIKIFKCNQDHKDA